MTDDEILDLYSDYRISSFGQTTATGLAALLDGRISHDHMRRFLAGTARTTATLWQRIKPHVRAILQDDGGLILDDSSAEKPHADETDRTYRQYAHSKERLGNGAHVLTALDHCQDVSFSVGITLIAKTEYSVDQNNGKPKRCAPIEKNGSYREMLQQATKHQIAFRYVLNAVWFSSAENMRFGKQTIPKAFVIPHTQYL